MHYVHIADEVAAYAAFKTNQVDLLRSVRSPQEAEDLRKSTPDAQEIECFEIPWPALPHYDQGALE